MMSSSGTPRCTPRGYEDLGLIEVAADAGEVVRRAGSLLLRPREPWLIEVDRFLAQSSWDWTWQRMLGLMTSALA